MLGRVTVFLIVSAIPLLAQPDKTAWDVLKQSLADKNLDKRRQALTAAGTISSSTEAARLVESALKDQDPLVRQTAAAVLGQMKSKESVPALKMALDDSSGEVA